MPNQEGDLPITDTVEGRLKPRIDDLLDRLAKLRADNACPICGGLEWHTVKDGIGLLAFVGDSADPQPLRLVAFICSQCQFLRSHVLSPLATEPEPQADV
jgi:hypothetical protein